MSVAPVLVIGVGSPDSGDDAVGPAVARSLARRAPAGVDVLVHEDPADLALLWRGRAVTVVVDALRSGAAPGTVRTMTISADAGSPAPWPSDRPRGTHDFGVTWAVDLARSLGTLPDVLHLVGIEGVTFGAGERMTEAVRAAIPVAAERTLALTRLPQSAEGVDAAGEDAVERTLALARLPQSAEGVDAAGEDAVEWTLAFALALARQPAGGDG